MKQSLVIFIVLFYFNSFSQNVEKPFRIDFKLGDPGVLGLNAEYVSPLLGNKLAFYVSFHGLNSNYHNKYIDEKVRYFDGGVNYFFKNTGDGVYASVGYGHLNLSAKFSEVVGDKGSTLTEAYGELKINSLNLKLGFKTKGPLFIRGEVGYGFSNIPKRVYVEGSLGKIKEYTFVKRPHYPGMSDSGYILTTIGIGFAF
ncbi:MAG: hypothetical protein KAH07_09640 [Flavobacteriaceae bacterium]|nr:hypothetical protein [Flavobacteriaceae bacterium]